LDTNLDKQPDTTKKNKLIATTWGTLLIILFLTIVSVGIYAPIKDYVFDSEDHVEQYIETRLFRIADTLADMTIYLTTANNLIRSEYAIHQSFGFNRFYTGNTESIKFHITNAEQTFVISNLSEPTQLREEIANSRLYLTLRFDEYGNPTVESSQDSDFNNAFLNGLSNRVFKLSDINSTTTTITAFDHATGTTATVMEIEHSPRTNIILSEFHHDFGTTVEIMETDGSFRNIVEVLDFARPTEVMSRTDDTIIKELTGIEAMAMTNLEITFIIPDSDILAIYSDFFTYEIKAANSSPHVILILAIAAISILLLKIIAFALPFSSQRQASIIGLFNKAPLEFKAMLWFGFILGTVIIARIVSNWWLPGVPYNIVNMIYDANHFFYLIGIPMTFILCLLIYLTICYIKHIYHEGLKEGLIKNSIIIIVLLYLFNGTKKLIRQTIDSFSELTRQIIELDMTQKYHKKFIILLLINLIILLIIASTWFFGIIIAVIYTFLLFRYGIKILDKVRTLNFATQQLAQGDFDVTIKEDLSLLNPIANNLNNIKDGFKVAVEKEVKSQNLKNELIANVSHDLKTPLTSIITYVDLLKTENITPETQKEYIEILDRKSQRLKVLIEDLFEASKAGSGNIELYPENLDVVALLRQTLGELEEKINNSTLDIKVNAPENKVICRLDGQKTYRVFENIMSNILKFSMPNSRVYIDILETEKEVSFVFKNISAYEMNFDASEITERFTRGDKSRTTEGSGLGLAIAKSLVELQKGTMLITIDGDLFKLTVNFAKSQQDEN